MTGLSTTECTLRRKVRCTLTRIMNTRSWGLRERTVSYKARGIGGLSTRHHGATLQTVVHIQITPQALSE
jgi:hypothetical protein